MRTSVVIPCHNAGPYLAQAIGSALDQTAPPHEVIVVDDASGDASLDVARRFEARFADRVRVLAASFGRATRARNLGAIVASGDAIMFLDADDVLAPDALEGLGDALSHQPGGVAICPWFRLARVAGRWISQPPSCAPRAPGEDALSAWLTGWYHPPCSVLWSRGAFEHAGRWDEYAVINQDGDLVMRALACGIPLVEAAKGSAFYRRPLERHRSLSGGRATREGLSGRIRVVRKIAFMLEDRGRIDRYRPAIASALARIAQDAHPGHPDLASEAVRLARRYDPPAWARFRRRLSRDRSVTGRGQPRRHTPAEVSFGLGAGREVLASDSSPAAHEPTSCALPTVSVIVPTYNRAHLLSRSIGSVLRQSFEDFELLVVDDGSTDGTGATMSSWPDRRVRYLRQPQNAGVAAARNLGIRHARGEFIAFLDSDDEWLPDKLRRQLELLRAVPEDVGLVYTGVESVYADGSVRHKCSRLRGDVYRDMLHTNVIHGGGSNVMIRRGVVAAAGFFDERLPAIEDYEYWLRITRMFAVDYVDEPLIRYYEPLADDRRSRATGANLEARWTFYRRHRAEMRRAGVAHLFFLKTARWAMNAPQYDVRAARRLAGRAWLEAPTSWTALSTFARTLMTRTDRRRGAGDGPLRVLLYSRVQPGDRGGVQAVIARIARHLQARRHTAVKAWAVATPPGVADPTYAPPHLVWRRGLPTLRSLAGASRALLRLVWVLRRHRPHVVNFHFVTRECLWFVRLKRLIGYKLVVSVHGSDVLRPKSPDAAVLSRVLSGADAITAVSSSTAACVSALPRVDPSRVYLIPNGVDHSFWSPRAAPPDGERDAIVLTVGRLHPVKGHDVLLHAFRRLRAQVPAAALVIVGEGGFRCELEHLCRTLRVTGSVLFAGELDAAAVRDWMWRSRVFVLPSRSEGLPLTLLEAMAAERPIVATRVGGIPDLLVPGTGVLVPPQDPDALAQALADLLLEPERAATLARNARERSFQFAGADADAGYERLFLELVGRRAPQPASNAASGGERTSAILAGASSSRT